MTSSKTRTERRFRGISMPTSSHPVIRRVKRRDEQPSIHGNKLWKSSCILIDYLHSNPPEHHSSAIDVGCGWGLAGIWCAKKLKTHVTSMDADANVMPYLEAVAQINGVTTTPLISSFEQLETPQLAQFDMLIAADICFWDELAEPVGDMIERALDAGVKHILIADPERAPFFEMANRCIAQHCAEVIEWRTKNTEIKARGALLIIENA